MAIKKRGIEKSTLKFLSDLSKNNNREWFTEHKDTYLKEHENTLSFVDDLRSEMIKMDNIEDKPRKKYLFRIYRDVRFSKDKTPYKSHFAGGMQRATVWLRGGYYYGIENGNCMIAGGFWNPESKDLKRIRDHIAADDKGLRKVLASKSFKTYFGQLEGEQVKTSPKGFAKDHPAIDLLKHKQFLVYRKFTNKAVTDPSFLSEVVKSYKAMRPFFDVMSEYLTTDLNGTPLH